MSFHIIEREWYKWYDCFHKFIILSGSHLSSPAHESELSICPCHGYCTWVSRNRRGSEGTGRESPTGLWGTQGESPGWNSRSTDSVTPFINRRTERCDTQDTPLLETSGTTILGVRSPLWIGRRRLGPPQETSLSPTNTTRVRTCRRPVFRLPGRPGRKRQRGSGSERGSRRRRVRVGPGSTRRGWLGPIHLLLRLVRHRWVKVNRGDATLNQWPLRGTFRERYQRLGLCTSKLLNLTHKDLTQKNYI